MFQDPKRSGSTSTVIANAPAQAPARISPNGQLVAEGTSSGSKLSIYRTGFATAANPQIVHDFGSGSTSVNVGGWINPRTVYLTVNASCSSQIDEFEVFTGTVTPIWVNRDCPANHFVNGAGLSNAIQSVTYSSAANKFAFNISGYCAGHNVLRTGVYTVTPGGALAAVDAIDCSNTASFATTAKSPQFAPNWGSLPANDSLAYLKSTGCATSDGSSCGNAAVMNAYVSADGSSPGTAVTSFTRTGSNLGNFSNLAYDPLGKHLYYCYETTAGYWNVYVDTTDVVSDNLATCSIAMSPDGTTLAYQAGTTTSGHIHIRDWANYPGGNGDADTGFSNSFQGGLAWGSYRGALLPLAALSWLYGGSNAAAPGLCQCIQKSGDPVNSENGDYSETSTDAKVATFGPPLTFERTYDSSLAQAQAASGTPGRVGYGWTDNWNMSLSVASGIVTINQANGAVVNFQTPAGGACSFPYVGSGASGTYCALPDVTASLTYDSSNSTYTFITHPYRGYTFNSSGQLTGESGPGGATLTLAYNTPAPGSGSCPSTATSCMSVTSPSGRTLVVASNSSGRVTSVTDPLGRSWSYTYCSPPSSTCSSGDLVSVTDPRSKTTSFTYDEGNTNPSLVHDLLTATKPNGQPGGPDAGDALVNVYNSSGRVTSQTDPAGNRTTFDYSHLNSSGDGYTLVTDPDGNLTQYAYSNGVLVDRTLGYGSSKPSTWNYQPDSSTLLDTQITDPNGHETVYTYNANGDLTSKTNPLGAVWSYSYNGYDQQTCSTLPLAASQCSSLSPPAAIPAGSTTLTPPAAAPPKYATYSEYDTAGNPIWTTTGDYNPGSDTASQSRTSYQLHNGQSVTLGGNSDSCNNSATDSSLPCATINPDDVVTQLSYNSNGDLTSSATADGNPGGELATTSYGYDADGELTTVTAPKGNLAGANAVVYTTTNDYNADGQRHSKTVSETGGGVTARTTVYGYDDDGNQISVTSPRTKETDYKYTADDQLTLVTDPDNQQTLTCYDGDGHVAETVPAVGVAANSLTLASCPSSYPSSYGDRLASDATTYSYDALGDRTTITTPAPAGQSGHEATTNAYDRGGRLTSVTAPPASNDAGAPNQVTAYTYDNADQLTSLTKGYGTTGASTTSYCYDPNGDKTAAVAPDGNTSGVATCASSAPYQTNSVFQTGYSYDSLSELVSETRPATTAAPSGQTTSYTYDPAGNQLTRQDPNGVTTTSSYTPVNQLATVSYSGSSAQAVSYGYDANGNRTSMSDASGNSSYSYDPFNEQTSSQNGAGQTLSYTYNDDGETSSITYPLGAGATWATSNSISYGYDNADLLNSITDFNGNTISIGNSADGLPNSLSLGSSGDTIGTTYDSTDTPSDVSLTNNTSTLLEFAYSNVPSGATSSETTTPSAPTSPADYTYDPQNRVTQLIPGSGSALNYTFDASGNLTTLPAGASGSYDNASELTSSTVGATTTNYTYNSGGERTQASQSGNTIASATYNGAEELVTYNNSAANMSAATYDGDHLRTSSTTTPAGGSATTQNYLWDTSGSTPWMLIDSSNAYIYGPGTAPLEQVDLTSGTINYLVADRLGSVRGTVNSSGSLTHSTSYDAWGNPQTSGGLTASTPFGYAGSYTDPTGLTYNIRRYYDPQTGQFISVDPAVDQTEAPYSYVNGNPVNAIDPVGLGCGWTSPWDCGSQAVSAVSQYVAQPIVNHAGTISSVAGGAAIVAYGFCWLGGSGCAVGATLSAISAGAASLNAARVCSRQGVGSSACVANAVGAGISIAGAHLGAKFASPNFGALPNVDRWMFAKLFGQRLLGRSQFLMGAASWALSFGAQQALAALAGDGTCLFDVAPSG